MPTNINRSYVEIRLQNVAKLDYLNEGFVHQDLFPVVQVDKRTGKIPEMGLESMRYAGSTKRNPYDTSPHRVDFKYLTDSTYSIEDYDVETFIPKELIDEAENPFNPANDARMLLKSLRAISCEVAISTLLSTSSNYDASNTSTPATLWSDPTSSPLTDLNTGLEEIEDDKGVPANHMIITKEVIRTLKLHPEIRSEFNKATTGLNVNKMLTQSDVVQILANFCEMPVANIHVTNAKYINSKPGQTETRTSIWNNDVILYWVPQSASLWVPSFGYRLNLRGRGMNDTFKMRPHPEDPDYGEIIKNMWSYQDLILDWDSAYLLDGVI